MAVLSKDIKPIRLLIVALAFLSAHSAIASGQQYKKAFTVADEVGLARFDDPTGWTAEAVLFSPNGNYFATHTERGRLDLNRLEGTLRFYRSQDVKDFLEHSKKSQPPSPIWVVNRFDKEGVVIRDWRWLLDSSGVAFLEHSDGGNQRLVLADLRKRILEPLTSATEQVSAFDICDRQHYVYTALDRTGREKLQADRQAPAIVGTGRQLFELILPDSQRSFSLRRNHVWAVVGTNHFEVKSDRVSLSFIEDFALSPNGQSLVAELPVVDVPSSWETLYPPPLFGAYGYRIRGGQHDIESHGDQYQSVHQDVRIDLQTGSVQVLTDAPTSTHSGWFGSGTPPSWSSDGQAILLPATFLKSKDNTPSRPCIAVVDLSSNTATCVEMFKARTGDGLGDVEEGYHGVVNVRFKDGDKQRVLVTFRNRGTWSFGDGATEYRRTANGAWEVAEQFKGIPRTWRNGLEVTVKQSFKEPQLLVASNKETSRVLWDPNPQLKHFSFGQVSVYAWKDTEGRDRRGGLYKPSNYTPGQRYPLVIQTHGFIESLFEPSGLLPTAFAARELAGSGIMVLQVDLDQDHCPMLTPNEGPCAVSAYEAAVSQLVAKGLVDPAKIGIIGFSRTCSYVMEALAFGSVHLEAASITDGVLTDYFQYMLNDSDTEADAMIGARPFGEGLHLWLERSPGFNLDKITAPLLVVGNGPHGLLGMWQPYVGLRYLHQPVDLIMLNTDEHVVTGPSVRLASQGGSVDWFRFWLQDYEDPDPAKVEQYERWHELRKLRQGHADGSTTPQAVSN
jgi:dipeptidyl aminopeptidase/acylaminoacyl peptidase